MLPRRLFVGMRMDLMKEAERSDVGENVDMTGRKTPGGTTEAQCIEACPRHAQYLTSSLPPQGDFSGEQRAGTETPQLLRGPQASP